MVKENRRVVGGLGSCLDSALCPLEKRKCKIIGMDVFAERHPNGSFSESVGVLGLLKSKSVDIYLKGEPQNLDLPGSYSWLKSTIPFKSEGFHVGHQIFKTNNIDYFDVIKNANIGLKFALYCSSFLLLSLLLCFSVVKLANKLQSKQIKFKYVLSNEILNSRPLRLSAIGLALYGLHLFLNFCQLFVLNQIQAEKIVVDSSELIKSDHELLNTNKVACLVKEEIETNIFDPNSLISQVIKKKMNFRKDQTVENSLFDTGKCLLQKGTPMHLLFNSPVFYVGTQIFELSIYWVYTFTGMSFKVWRYSKPVHEVNHVLYYSMKNPDNHQLAKDL